MKPTFLLCLALILSVFSAKIAEAQPLGRFPEASLEARIAQAQSVFRGVISNSTRRGRQGDWGELILTVQVEEVIKGPPCQTVEFAVQAFGIETNEIQQSTATRTPFLCFVDDLTGQAPAGTNLGPVLPPWNILRGVDFWRSYWSVIRLAEAVPAERTVSGDPHTAEPAYVYAMDTTVLTKPEEILERTRGFAKSGITTTKMHELDIGPLLVVPVSPPLEAAARRWVMLPDGNGMRAVGAKALRYFKSAENIELLKPLLNDHGTNTETYEVVWMRRRTYPARKAAYEVLQEWGVTVPKPVTAEVLPWEFNPAARHNLKLQIPTKLRIDRTTTTLAAFPDIVPEKDTTNVSAGLNMVIGIRVGWFIYPEGAPRPANATRFELTYTGPSTAPMLFFNKDHDGLPVPGQKYNIEMDYTVFETDNPPPYDLTNEIWEPRVDTWRPQDGKNYRVLLQRTLQQTSE